MDIFGPILAISLCALEVFAIWRWGFAGCVDRMKALIHRLAHGPTQAVAIGGRVDYAKIARLERELDM